jgi:UDP-glucose 4-epimerase
MNILITGGAGYIGSQMVRMLSQRSVNVTVIDTLEHGYAASLPENVSLVTKNVGDKEALNALFSSKKFDGVIHFAGYLSVEESVKNPRKYFNNNVISPLSLLESMEEHQVPSLIFSSTAAVYGNPVVVPIPEDHPKNPTSPYGLSKWCFEELLQVFGRRGTIQSISLRYFNAAGAPADGGYGEAHVPETHLIPLAMSAALGKRVEFSIYGTDYDTKDGSAVRDYIHITDLCQAHIMALEALANGHTTDVYNVGTGDGWSVRDVIRAVKKESGIDFSVSEKGRRSGDPAVLVADSSKLRKEFGWKPESSDLSTIVTSAWKWHKMHPDGYK